VALDTTGIANVNEFYSHHYLDALLESDLKGLLSRWEAGDKEENRVPPYKLLSRCAEDYFKAKTRAADTATDEDRFTETHPLNVRLVEALNYPYHAGEYELIEDDRAVPVLASLKRDGNPYLWLVEAAWADEDHEPLKQRLADVQMTKSGAFRDGYRFPHEVWEDLLSLIFRREQPPRWVMLLAGSLIFLVERHKWGQGKYLLFDIDQVLGRKQADTVKATAGLLSRDALCPDDGTVLHDTLDDNSHKHAFAVSGDLKYGLRKAVELLANEYVWYQRNIAKQALFGDDDLARKLTVESLTYLYRLLFLFYAEARGDEVGVLPMKSDEYREGYSLESLRDLEQMPLTTEAAQNGYFIDHSLRKLFELVNDGFQPQEQAMLFDDELPDWWHRPQPVQERLAFDGKSPSATPVAELPVTEAQEESQYIDHGFTITGLESPLFDSKRTPLLSSMKFRNVVLQETIQLLSLSREGGRGSRRRERGRISYAELGINQLGAVYEGLLSYSGFFAKERLYEVKPAGASPTDETQQSYFVPESEVGKYNDDELVYEEVDGGERGERRRKKYEKGTFVFRLAGRDREKSASYYTPECLTQCVVKYALKELLKDKTADEILKLTLCEPAMGSGAFLNEAINQLADAYLERKQKELGETISPGDYPVERQRAKAYLATHNCYGVDLNPVAVELAKVSLWLNTIYAGSRCPWFGLRLAVGNSLIGARRQVFGAADLKRRNARDNPNWLGMVPKHVPAGPTWQDRPKDSVYHFLVPDEGMAGFDTDRVIKGLAPEEVQTIKEWRREFCKPFDRDDVAKLIELSDAVDALWKQVIRERKRAAEKTNQPIPVWGQEAPKEPVINIPAQEKVAAELDRYYTAYRRLKLAMDYWCALWFWPIPDAATLPSRDEFLFDMELILKGMIQTPKPDAMLGQLFPDEPVNPEHVAFVGRFGMVNIEDLLAKNERLRIVDEVASRVRFHHWELRFAEVFAERGGFDLIIGNPPWVRVSFNEAGVLSDDAPLVAIRQLSATEIGRDREQLLDRPEVRNRYFDEFVTQTGTKSLLGCHAMYPSLKGLKANLYKCFLTRAWEIGGSSGVAGFVHPEGVYDDPSGGSLRELLYLRLRGHFQFVNELSLFPEVDHHVKFSVNVYSGSPSDDVRCLHATSLYHPSSLDASMAHDGAGAIPGIKDDNNEWDLRPHRHRLIQIDRKHLALFGRLFDELGTEPQQARLPAVHSVEVVSVLEKLSSTSRKLVHLGDGFFVSKHWNEVYAQQDGTIRRETAFPRSPEHWVLSGPHIHIGTPFFKTPNEHCHHNLDYSDIDLLAIPEDYLPRTNYIPNCPLTEYRRRSQHWRGRPIVDYYRHAHRDMLAVTGERTLIPSIIPLGVGHFFTVISICFANLTDLLTYNGLASSLVVDFFVKVSGVGHANTNLASSLPLPELENGVSWRLHARVLRLNCLTAAYRKLWVQTCPASIASDSFAKFEARLGVWRHLSAEWQRASALRTDFERRQALVEIDALAALALGLTEDELITIYRIQFPVLRQYERENLYDQTGRLVPKGILDLAKRHNFNIRQPLNVSGFTGPAELIGEVQTPGLGVTGGIAWEDPKMEPRMMRVYPPPFTKCDREADMRQAYQVFQERLRSQESAP
jgi:hypothetical protein